MGEPNSPDDVRLVQQLFIVLAPWLTQTFRGLPSLSATGVFAPDLETRIRRFQGTSREMAQDGKIHPIQVRNVIS
jgi:hypothetical protein